VGLGMKRQCTARAWNELTRRASEGGNLLEGAVEAARARRQKP